MVHYCTYRIQGDLSIERSFFYKIKRRAPGNTSKNNVVNQGCKMRNEYVYGQLFACLEVIDAKGFLYSEPTKQMDFDPIHFTRISYLFKNHRRKLNEMDAGAAKLLET